LLLVTLIVPVPVALMVPVTVLKALVGGHVGVLVVAAAALAEVPHAATARGSMLSAQTTAKRPPE
jgi:hypothetical protein